MKFKETNQILKAHVIEITKTYIVAFMKARNSSIVNVERRKPHNIVKIFF